MTEVLGWLDTSGFMPHGHCYLWQPGLLGLHAGSDSLIALAYFSIPALLWNVLRKRGDEAYTPLARLFAAFIVLCGSTHLMAVYTIWVPAYLPDGLLKAATAIVSVTTAVALWRLTPMLIAIPRPEALEKANRELVEEMAERRRAEGERDAERVRSIRILEATSDAIVATDRAGRVVFANRSAGALLGKPVAALLGVPLDTHLALFVPGEEGAGAVTGALVAEALREGGLGPRRLEMRGIDGETRHVLASATGMDDHERDGTALVLSLADITAAQTAQAAIARAERFDALGRFAGGFAHDFNNLLTAVSGNIEIVGRRLPERPDLQRHLQAVLAAARRGSALTRRLLMMSRHHVSAPRLVEPARFVADLEMLLDSTAGEAVTLVIQAEGDLPPVMVDPAEFEAALLNLAINARDAMPAGGTLSLRMARHDMGAAGTWLEIAMDDTGTGIPPDVLDRVFEPFFTTKEVGHGSGLGLSMVQGFVTRNGGTIEIDTAEGRGTTIRIRLPAAVAPAERDGTPSQAAPSPAMTPTTVLVVEDQELVRDMTVGMVEELGHRVLAAGDAHAALDLLRTRPDIGILLSDVILPRGLDGAALALRARAERPDLVVVLCSGYPADKLTPEAAGLPLLRKPFGLEELAAALRRATDPLKGA